MQPKLIAVLHRGLRPVLEPEIPEGPGIAAEPDRDDMVKLVVLRGARQAVGQPALDGIRYLPRGGGRTLAVYAGWQMVSWVVACVTWRSTAPGTGAR